MLHHRKIFALLMIILLLSGCASSSPVSEVVSFNEFTDIESESTPAASNTPISSDRLSIRETPEGFTVTEMPEEESTPAFDEYDVTLMAVGDNLIHMGVVYTGKQNDGSYDFSFLFQGITDFLNKADVKIINQETIMAGNQLGFHGFPHFNSPTEVGDAIANAGFNVVLQATNHSADQGIDGIDSCVSFWRNHPEVLLTGLHEPDNRTIPTLTIKDVTFAILNYTYGPNYEIVSNKLASRMELLCARNEQTGAMDYTTINPQVLEDIKTAKELADIVVVCPHWGTEYQTSPSSYQQKFARQMTEAGADLIIGAHPHVVQPIEQIQTDNGNSSICYYSLGNYVSTQQNGRSMLEGMAWVTYHVAQDGISLRENKTGVIPLVCHYTSSPVRIQNIYPLENYTQELASSHGIISYGGISFSLSDLQQWSTETFGDWVLTKDAVLSD